MATILVCGGRNFADQSLFDSVMSDVMRRNRVGRIIQGGATGADAMARDWCVKWGYTYEHFPADWKTDGRAAGPIRNRQMIEVGKPHLVIAFPGGRGTADMVRQSKAAGVEVLEVSACEKDGRVMAGRDADANA